MEVFTDGRTANRQKALSVPGAFLAVEASTNTASVKINARPYEAVLLPFLLVFEQPHREFIVPIDHDLTARIREYKPFVVRTAPGPERRGEHLL